MPFVLRPACRVAAVGRGLFGRYRFTDRRISCITSAPWQSEWCACMRVCVLVWGGNRCSKCNGGSEEEVLPHAMEPTGFAAISASSAAVLLCSDAAEQLDAAYQEVKTVISIGRGVGLWGDMVVTLNDGSKIEMRALPRCGVGRGWGEGGRWGGRDGLGAWCAGRCCVAWGGRALQGACE